ncbi:MAG: hypothetical protein HON90_15625, partial [Halobacteriovoraceae bacterium]|nr:hypothetical protein [Halobacteriovoraceae bacterium]
RSQGNWTKLALSDARSLISTLESLRDDDDCKSVSGAISKLANLEGKLSSLDSDYSEQIEIAKLEAQEMELMSQLSSVSDPTIISQIEASLRTIQIDKAGYVGVDDYNSQYNGGELKNFYSQIINSTSSAFNAVVSNQLCLDNNPSLLAAATSLSGSIAASAAYINPALGLGLATVTDFIGTTVEYFRNRGFNTNIKNIANGSTVLEGFKCAMESLSNRWCEIKDAEKFLEFEEKMTRDPSVKSEISVISKIFDKDLPVFLHWLEKVKAGAPASNTADAGRRQKIYYRDASVRAAKSNGEGLFSENSPLYDAASSSADKYSIIRSVINKITEKGKSDKGPVGPLFDIYTVKFAPYYLLGLSEIPVNAAGNLILFEDFDPFKSILPAGSYNPNFQLLMSQYTSWVELAQKKVTQELNIVLQPDPLQIISIFSERTSNVWKHAPADALKNIISFVSENKPDDILDTPFDDLYDTTVARLNKISKAIIGDFDLPPSCMETNIEVVEVRGPLESISQLENIETANCDRLRRALEIIFQESQLEFGSLFFKNRLETIIRVSIDKYIKNSQSSNQNHIAQLLAADSFLDVLSLISGTDNYAKIKMDLKKAKPIVLNNMISFGNVFGGYINGLFWSNNYLVNNNDPTISEAYKDDRAHMCFLLASLPRWPNAVKMTYCYGMQLTSMVPGGPESVVINYKYLTQPFAKRSCVYSDYLRKSKIYQDWGINLQKSK